MTARKKAPTVAPPAPVAPQASNEVTPVQGGATSELDVMSLQQLRAMRFTLPITLEDMRAMMSTARLLPWSGKAVVEVFSHDWKNVTLRVFINGRKHEVEYNGSF